MSTELLAKYGFQSPRSGLATNAAEAGMLARKVGFPVALKVVSPDILHKTDVGGVRLGLGSESDVEAAFRNMLTAVESSVPEAEIEGIMIEEMCTGGQEIIIGLLNDAQFGPSIMFGLGGIMVEILQDVSFRVLPITEADARAMIGEIKGRKVLEGFRGSPAVSIDLLVDLLVKAGRLGMDHADQLESADFNPITVWGNEHRVLDFKLLLTDEERAVVDRQPNTKHVEKLFEAKSVALVGASDTPGKIGNAVMDSLANHQYNGKIYPINPARDRVMGLPAYPSITALPEPVDLVIVTVALSVVPGILEECASKGIHDVVIVSGGGKELGGESKELEASIARLAREKDLRVVGPNCIGIFDGESRLDTFFQVQERMVRPPRGPVAMLTQSGTVGAVFMERAQQLGMSKFASFGNRVDVDESDLSAYLAGDPDTKVIACYIEGLADGRKFLNTARSVVKQKPIVVFKGGRTERGARASISHTGFFGGSYALFNGAMNQAGVVSVDSTEELYAASKALALQSKAAGRRMAMISNGAGTMVQAIDLLEQYGMELGSLVEGTVERLTGIYPSYYLVQNPVDVTGSATTQDYKNGIEALLQDPNVDVVMPWFVFQDTPLGEDIVEALADLNSRYQKPILCGAGGGPFTERLSRAIEAQGVPVLSTVREWMAAAKAVSFGSQS